jgi:hypothetical protein
MSSRSRWISDPLLERTRSEWGLVRACATACPSADFQVF